MSTLQDLLTEELRDLYDAEKQLVKALPKMAKAAARPDLKKVLDEHTNVTRTQVERLEQIFALIDERPRSKPCKGMKGLVEEGQEVMSEHAGDEMLDSAMIGAAQRVEHYEIAGYTSAKEVAEILGLRKAAQLLDKTLKEEQQADQKLSQVSAKILKVAARKPLPPDEKRVRGGGGPGKRSPETATARGRPHPGARVTVGAGLWPVVEGRPQARSRR